MPATPSPKTAAAPDFPPKTTALRIELLIAIAFFALALALRLPAAMQSLWYDELSTLIYYISGSWSQIVQGRYSPNNHILFNLLAKLCSTDYGNVALQIRLP